MSDTKPEVIGIRIILSTREFRQLGVDPNEHVEKLFRNRYPWIDVVTSNVEFKAAEDWTDPHTGQIVRLPASVILQAEGLV